MYVDSYHAQGKMVAHLSDASSPDYVNTTINSTGVTVQEAFTFVYKAASSGQTLSVTFTNIANNSSNANIALEAAALVGTVGSPDFSLAAAPGSQSVAVGEETPAYTATVTALNGFAGSTGFSVSGLPTGATASFSPTTVTGKAGPSTMTVTTSANTPVGSSTLTITGTSGALVHNYDGDAGSYGSGRFLAGGGAGIAIGGGGWKHGLHGDGDGAEDGFHGEHGLRGKRVADGSDSEFQSDKHGDGDGIVHLDGDNEREYAGGKFHADHHGNERSAGPYYDGDAGSYGSGRFLAGGGAGIAIGGGGGKRNLHGNGDGAERVRGKHGLRGKRAADGSDGEFQSDNGDGDGIVHLDGDNEREYAGRKFHSDHHGNERSAGS